MENRLRGFTLIEIMVTVAIVGILAAIAYPSYIEQVRKSRRADAKTALVTAAQTMERFFTEKNSYAAATAGDAAGSTISDHAPADHAHADRTYNIALNPAPSATGFTITATRAGLQAGDTTCGDYALTNTGVKSVTVGTVASCW